MTQANPAEVAKFGIVKGNLAGTTVADLVKNMESRGVYHPRKIMEYFTGKVNVLPLSRYVSEEFSSHKRSYLELKKGTYLVLFGTASEIGKFVQGLIEAQIAAFGVTRKGSIAASCMKIPDQKDMKIPDQKMLLVVGEKKDLQVQVKDDDMEWENLPLTHGNTVVVSRFATDSTVEQPNAENFLWLDNFFYKSVVAQATNDLDGDLYEEL